MIPQRIQYLLGSCERVQLLNAISRGVATQSKLAADCEVARSTVHRNLDGLLERGWVTTTEDGYRLTAAGESILVAYREFAEAVRTVGEHEPFLQQLEPVDSRPPASALAGCETTVATEANPHAPSVEVAAMIRRNAGERMRIAVIGVSPITNQATREAVEAGSDLELLFDTTVLETLQRDYDAAASEALEHESLTMRLSQGKIETGLVVTDDEICVVVQGDGGNAVACLTGTTPEIRTWAEQIYERLHERTRLLSAGTDGVPTVG